jgi:glutaconate CoA-transferase subunit A
MPTQFLTADEAVRELIPSGATVAVGGMHMSAAPLALVRALIRQEIRIGRLVTSPSTSLQADLLLAAGLVHEIVSPYVGFEHLGLAPSFRRVVEAGTLRVLEIDEGSLTHALYAGAGGLPFVPCPPGLGRSAIPGLNPEFFKRARNPYTGESDWAVKALRPDTSLLACAVADEDGNVAFGRFPFTDRLMALAARNLVVQVEEVVPAGSLSDRSPGETIPAFLVSAVVLAPRGAHPTGSPGYYERDDAALRAYLTAARDPQKLAEYLSEVAAVAEASR